MGVIEFGENEVCMGQTLVIGAMVLFIVKGWLRCVK